MMTNLRRAGHTGGWAALILLLLSLTACDTVVTEVEGIRIQGLPLFHPPLRP